MLCEHRLKENFESSFVNNFPTRALELRKAATKL